MSNEEDLYYVYKLQAWWLDGDLQLKKVFVSSTMKEGITFTYDLKDAKHFFGEEAEELIDSDHLHLSRVKVELLEKIEEINDMEIKSPVSNEYEKELPKDRRKELLKAVEEEFGIPPGAVIDAAIERKAQQLATLLYMLHEADGQLLGNDQALLDALRPWCEK